MPATKHQLHLHSRDCIPYRGYYIIANHDDSILTVTSNGKDRLITTSSLCAAYLHIDNLVDMQSRPLASFA